MDVPLSLLADLQAGRLDDDTAARVRHLARTDPHVADQLAALDGVRRDVAALGVDEASAPDVPADVTARVGDAIRTLDPPRPRWRRPAAVAGIVAAVAAAGIGTAVLVPGHDVGPPAAASVDPPSRRPGAVPLSHDDVLGLLSAPAELGPLAEPQRLASCLGALGYPTSTTPLGGRLLTVADRPGVLLLLADDVPGRIDAVFVATNCSSVDTGLLASTVVTRP